MTEFTCSTNTPKAGLLRVCLLLALLGFGSGFALCFGQGRSLPEAASGELLAVNALAPEHLRSKAAVMAESTGPGLPPRAGTPRPQDTLQLLGTPLRILQDERGIVKSPAKLGKCDLPWLLPLVAAAAATLATDTRVMRGTVSHDPGFNSSNATSSDVIRGAFIGGPVLLFGLGEIGHTNHEREAGLLAGEAMVNGYVTSEAVKYITLRERPYLQNARGHFFQSDAASDPSFVSGHAIVAWSSAAALAGEYSKPWQQAVLYSAAAGLSVNRVLAQQHFPTDVLLGAASGWLIGHYVYRKNHARDLR